MAYSLDKIQFDIDNDLRIITIPDKGDVIGVIGDNNTNRINFRMPRYYNGFDMSVFLIMVSYLTPDGHVNYYEVTDIINDDEYLYFSWLVSYDVTQYSGEIYFSVKMVVIDGEQIKQIFNTTIGKGYILDTIQTEYVKPDQHWIGDYIASDADIASYLNLSIGTLTKVNPNYVSNYIATDSETTEYLND